MRKDETCDTTTKQETLLLHELFLIEMLYIFPATDVKLIELQDFSDNIYLFIYMYVYSELS